MTEELSLDALVEAWRMLGTDESTFLYFTLYENSSVWSTV